MKCLIIPIFIFIFSNTCLIAQQVSADKVTVKNKWFAELGFNTFFNFGYPTAQNKGPRSFPYFENTGDATFMDRYDLSVYYRFSGLHSIKASYNYSVSGLATQYSTYATTGGFADFDAHDLFYQLHMHDIGISVMCSYSNSFNPISGFYWDMGIKAIFMSANLRDQRVVYHNNKYPDNIPRNSELNPLGFTTNAVIVGFPVEIGYRFIVKNKLIFNFSVNSTVIPQYFGALGWYISEYIPHKLASQNDLINEMVMNVTGRYFLNIRVGVGYIIK